MAANGGEGEEELVDFEGSDYGFEEGTEAELRGEDSALAGGGGGAEQEQEQEEEVEEEAGRRGVQQEDSSTAAKEVPNEGIQVNEGAQRVRLCRLWGYQARLEEVQAPV